MEKVSVKLTSPWPTAAGLRRPQEGIITVSAEEAEKIKTAKAGKIIAREKAAATTADDSTAT